MLLKTEILKEPINPFLCKVLVCELMFGRKQLNGQSKPVQCVLSYQEKLEKALSEVGDMPTNQQKQLQYKGNNQNVFLSLVSARECMCKISWTKQWPVKIRSRSK